MSQEYPFPKPLDKSVLVCTNFGGTYPKYQWKQPPQDSEKKYYLSSDNQNIDWREVEAITGEGLGQIPYWDPSAGSDGNGALVLTVAPAQGQPEKFLYWDGSSYAFAEVKEFQVCESGGLKTYKIPAIEVL